MGPIPTPLDSSGYPDYSKCEYVMLTGADYNLLGPNDLMRLSPQAGLDIAYAIGLLWAIAAIFRLIAKSIDVNPPESEK